MATKKIPTTAQAVAKYNLEAAKNQHRPIATQVVETLGKGKTKTHKLETFWNSIDGIAKGTKKMPYPTLRSNANARRQWCRDNNMPVVFVNTIAERVGERVENTLREKMIVLAGISTYAGKIGYIRVLDSNTIQAEPNHPMVNGVYIYKM
jgi:hypothetical protein